jgi:uncharacterized protein
MRLLQVRVRPGAREGVLEQQPGGEWSARLKAPPVDGKANAELLELVARRFGVPKSCVSIRRGATGRVKVVQIDD